MKKGVERIGRRVREMREDERNGQKEEVVVHKRIGCKVYCTVENFMQTFSQFHSKSKILWLIFRDFVQNQPCIF